MPRITALLACLIFFCSPGFCQSLITGVVTDQADSVPLQGVEVTLLPSKAWTRTGPAGLFRILAVPGTDSLRFSRVGFLSANVAVSPFIRIGLVSSSSGLNEIIVSADREAQPRTQAPMAISVITPDMIDHTKATQLDQLLNQSAGVYMVDLGNQQHAMAIRQPLGYNNYYLYMEDGIPIRVEGDFNHNALIEINDAAIDRVEILKGPASSIYGSEAVGGAVNVITSSPTLSPTVRIEAEGGSFGYGRTDFSVSGTHHRLGIWFGGYVAGRSQPDSLYDNFSKLALSLKAVEQFSDRTRLTLSASEIRYYTDQKGGLDSAEFFSKDYLDAPISNQRFTYRRVDALRARATLDQDWSQSARTSFTFYYRNNLVGQNPFYDEGSTTSPSLATGQINSDAFTSWGTLVQHTQALGWLSGKWITGLSADYSPEQYRARFIWIKVSPEGVYNAYSGSDSMLVSYTAHLYNTAAYTQLELNPAARLKLTGSIRYDRLDYTFTNALTPGPLSGPADTLDHFGHLAPKLGLTYDFGKQRGIYANYSLGFAPPNITDLYSGYTVPDLKPSTFYNYEAGGWWGFSGKGFAELSLYRMNGIDEIVPIIQANGVSLEENAGKTSHTGIEVDIRYDLGAGWKLRIAGTAVEHRYVQFTDGKNNVSGNIMADSPPVIGNSELDFSPSLIRGLNLSLQWQTVAAYYTDPEDQHRYNGYNSFNLRVNYRQDRLECWAQCLNLTDKVYATIVTYGYGQNTYYPGMLRTFNLGMGYTLTKGK